MAPPVPCKKHSQRPTRERTIPILERMVIIMLEQQDWITYAPHILTEWETCLAEGRDVEKYKQLAIDIHQLQGKKEALAIEAGKLMTEAPIREDFSYVEPSTLEEIRAARPKKQPALENHLNAAQWRDKLQGAWIGRISGCLLGKPLEGIRYENLQDVLKTTDNYPMSRYITSDQFTDELCARSAWPLRERGCWAERAPRESSPSTTTPTIRCWPCASCKIMDGISGQPTCWRPGRPTIPICRSARLNAFATATPLWECCRPKTATYRNPFREMVGARIRGDFFGFVTPGEIELAAELGWRDASISHVKNGIYGEMYICAMIAAAAVCDDMESIIEAGLSQIPENSRHYQSMRQVIAWYKEGLTAEQTMEKIQELHREDLFSGWCGTIPNDMIVTMALLYGEGDFGRSICLAVQAAYDTDCNGATVGSIVGIRNGKSKIDPYWIEPYQERLSTAILDYSEVTVEELVDKTLEVIAKRNRK